MRGEISFVFLRGRARLLCSSPFLCRLHVRRVFAALCGAAAWLPLAGVPASAQFVCTTTPADINCANSGSADGNVNHATGNRNATTTNSGTNDGVIDVQTLGLGTATASNSGTNNGGNFGIQAVARGSAIVTNSGTNFGGLLARTQSFGAVANVINSGINYDGMSAAAFSGGNATLTNSGVNTGNISAETFGAGNATIINSGINSGFITALVVNSGNAATINSGTHNGIIVTTANGGGNAMATNSGTINGTIFMTAGGGTSSVINTGTVVRAADGGPNEVSLAIEFHTGNTSMFNAGTVTGNVIAIAFMGTGNTLTLAPGSVINGAVRGSGSDVFQLGGNGAAALDASAIAPAAQYQGFATFNKIGGSTWTLTGTGAADQNWIISAGTLIGDSQSLKGATPTNNAALIFAQDFNGAYAGAIGGTGTLGKSGSGTLTLSGTSSYTGATQVNAGTLSVNGSIASSSLTTVNAGGTLGGNGNVGNTTINGGALAPGNSIGQLTVQGSLLFTAASSYMVEVSPANADRTNVTGSATLGGATVNASFAPGTYAARQYTIVNATGGVIGTFNDTVKTNLSGGFTSSLSYDANNVYLNLEIGLAQYSGLNVNQQNVANAIADSSIEPAAFHWCSAR